MSPSEHLEDLTNEPRPLRLPQSLVDMKRPSSLYAEPPSRIQRLQRLDSSETFPSEHTSIYDAEPVVSENEESLEVSKSDHRLNPNVPPFHMLRSPSIEIIAPSLHKVPSPAESVLRALNIHFSPKRQWPATRLDTISERLSQRTPRSSLSQMRAVSASVDLRLRDAVATSLINSPPVQREFETYHRRSFSLNDLDCLKPPKAQHSFVHGSSSSSGDALRAACLCEVYPVHPTEGPPLRIPTPPGLPTFGTREAIEYRMPAAQRTSWLTLRRTNRIASEAARSSAALPGDAAAEVTSTMPPTLTDGLKRLLGITRILSPIPEVPRRAPMPHYLARADDGTFVRGRFGTRHSAHGSHRGQMDNHPFNRDIGSTSGTRQTNLDRVIQEIDKACAQSERRRLASASPRAHGQSSPRSGNSSPRLLPSGQRAFTIAEVLSQQPPPNTPASPNMSLRQAGQTVRSPTLTFDQIGSQGSIRSQSTISGIDGVRHFIEQGERVSLEQTRELIKQKKQRSGCANFWFAFWVACCGLEDPDGEILDSRRVMSPEMRGLSAAQSPEIRLMSRRVVDEQPRSGAGEMLYC